MKIRNFLINSKNKMGDLYLNGWYIVFAAILAAGSFALIHFGNKKSAERSQNKITEKTDDIVNKAVTKATQDLKQTTQAVTKNAVGQISKSAANMKRELNQHLKTVEYATTILRNQIENQEVLLQVEYEFDLQGEVPKNFDIQNWVSDMRFELLNNNFYQLTIKSNNTESQFEAEIKKFYPIGEREELYKTKEAFINSVELNEIMPNPRQVFNVNHVLKTKNLNFLLGELKEGDVLNFSILKKKYGDLITPSGHMSSNYYNNIIENILDGNSWPKTNMIFWLKLKNGFTFKAERTKSDSYMTSQGISFQNIATISEIIKPEK